MGTLTDSEWDKLFELLDKLVNAPGAWRDKAEELHHQALARDYETVLTEFGGWFQEQD